jgi:glucose/arabinose dehydrogenase
VTLWAQGGQSGGQASLSVNGSPPQALTSSTVRPYTFVDANLPAVPGAELRVTASGTGTGHNAILDYVTFPASSGGTPTPTTPQCSNNQDDDRDGLTDHPNDPGCTGATGNDETDPAATPLPPGFTQSRVVSGLTNPTDMEFAPDGRLFVTEQAGTVRIAKPDGTLATFLNISTNVNSSGERGLQALTFDPGFSTNRYVYLHYTKKATSTTPVHNRIVRVTANADSTKVVSGSETLILRLNNQSTDHHMGGAIDFGTDGKLYIATGDNQTPTNVSQNLANLFGKMLRINKDGTIPTDNPFYTTTSGNNRAIWARGLRNPFKFAVQPGKGTIIINDVGEKAWEEINEGSAGANYGWPVHEGVANDPQYVDPVFALAYGQDGACSITGGAFYNPETLQFPSGYVGDYFFADFCGGWVRSRDPLTGAVSGFAKEIVRPVDLEVSKGGELYYLSRGNSSTPGSVGKIRYASNP